MESTNFWHLSAGIPAQDDFTTFHSSSAFLGFASETALLIAPYKFSIGLWSGNWSGHSITLTLLEPRYYTLAGVFGIIVPFQGHFLFSKRQYDLKYFDISKLVHDPWYAINGTNTMVGETARYHEACSTMFHSLQSVLWLEFSVGGHLTRTLWPLDSKRTILLSSVHKIFLHFSLSQVICSLANCILFSACLFF